MVNVRLSEAITEILEILKNVDNDLMYVSSDSWQSSFWLIF